MAQTAYFCQLGLIMSTKVAALKKTSKHSSSNTNPQHSWQAQARHQARPFFPQAVQAKIKIGQAKDPYERQADQVADGVVAGKTNLAANVDLAANDLEQAKPLAPKAVPDEKLQRQKHEQKDLELQAKEQPEESLQAKANEEQQLQAKSEDEEETLQAQAKSDENLQAKANEEQQLQAKSEDEEETLQAQAESDENFQATMKEKALKPQQVENSEEQELQAKQDDEQNIQTKVLERKVKTENPEQAFQQARSQSGNAMENQVQAKMERAFNVDFSGVRIHTDQAAVALNQQLGARALTNDQDIYFNQNQFRPNSRSGLHLLAHELTHTLQQKRASIGSKAVQAKLSDDIKEDGYQIRPELLEALRHARSQIGLVNAKQKNEQGFRQGFERLLAFFNKAFGGELPINEEVIKKVSLYPDKDGNLKDALPSWCGIFVWWSLKQGGVPIPDWKLGHSVMAFLQARPKGQLPRKGDIAYRMPFQHFAIVSGVKVDSAGNVAQVATINGNTAGQDNLGGQIEEQWDPVNRWLGFFDPVAKLDMPEITLVHTGLSPDLDEIPKAEQKPADNQSKATASTESDIPDTEPDPADQTTAEAVTEISPEENVTLELPDIPPAPPMEVVAAIEPLDMAGSSDQAVASVAKAKPSQLAQDGDKLGQAVSKKLVQEQQQEVTDAPKLQVKLAGNVTEGITPADQLMPSSADITDGKTAADPEKLTIDPHQNHGDAPSNKANEQQLEKQSKSDSFLDWLKNNMRNFLNSVRTTDNNLNTSAGAKQKVSLQGSADPNRMASQKEDAGGKLRGKRDEVTGQFTSNPGQSNIQAKSVNEDKPVAMAVVPPEPVATEASQPADDYANAELPEAVRKKADENLSQSMQKNLNKADQDAQSAAQTKQKEKNAEIAKAEKETQTLNKKADAEQRTQVIDNRKKVSDQQKLGIKDAFDKVKAFDHDAGKEQVENKKSIDDKVKTSQEQADTELEKGEKEAEEKKKSGEKEAAEKKAQLDKEQKKESWWDRVKSAVKSAVKALTSAIDKIFNAIRSAVKTIIEKAKNAAIGLINAARNFVVDKLNKFRDWAKNQVNKYLGEAFPGLAAKINGAIDSVVDTAIAGVNMVADGAIAAVEAVANALAAALDRILAAFQAGLKAAVEIIGAVLTGDFLEALKIAIRAGCEIAGIDSKPIFDFFEKAGNQLVSILKSPGKFFNNLVTAVGMGVRSFVKNIKQHLIKGLIEWLTGAMSSVPITLPEKFDLKGIIDLVLQILGLTYANIKARIIKKYPKAEKVFAAVEKGVEIVRLLVTEGPIALWKMIKQSLANLKEMVMGAIRNFVITTVVKEAVTWLLGLLNPAGALVKILKLLFDLVMFFVERFQQIKDFVLSVYGAISSLAAGVLGKAAKAVENAMARSLPVVIGLLASLAGLGGIGKTVSGIIKKVTTPINKVIDKVIDTVVKFAKKLLGKGKGVAKKIKDKLTKWWKVKKNFTAEDGASHSLFFKGEGKGAKLTMRSEEQPYQSFINSLDESSFTAKQKPHLAKAKLVAAEIDAKRKEPLSGSSKEEKAKQSDLKQKALGKLLVKLGQSTKFLFTEVPNWKKPTYGGVNSAGFGTSMNIDILTKKGPGWKDGSAPSQAAQTTYDVLNTRRQSGGASFYIRGHLLNDNVGGPGKWFNMTPLSREGNHQHESQIESYIKAGFNSGAIMRYKVVPQYGGQSGDEALKQALKAKYPTQETSYNKIIDAEQNVPKGLQVEAARMKKKGAKFEDVESKAFTILNPIQRSADKYFLADSPKVVAIDINTLTSSQALINQGHGDITPQATAIFKAVQARRNNKQILTKIGSYKTLADEAAKYGGSFSGEDAKGWNTQGYVVLKT